MLKTRAKRIAVSSVIPVLPLINRSTRVRGTSRRRAKATTPISSGSRYSSFKTSPGCVGFSNRLISVSSQWQSTISTWAGLLRTRTARLVRSKADFQIISLLRFGGNTPLLHHTTLPFRNQKCDAHLSFRQTDGLRVEV